MYREITHKDKLMAIIIKANYHKEGISFFTEASLSQQLAYMQHPKGYMIEPHMHNKVKREVLYTQEVLLVRKGKIRIDFYDDERKYIESYILERGDVILLICGGHGFEVLDDVEMFEIKQGPYAGDRDKVRFTAIGHDKLLYKK